MKPPNVWRNFYKIEAAVIRGAVNGDGKVTMADANAIVNIVLGKQPHLQTHREILTKTCQRVITY